MPKSKKSETKKSLDGSIDLKTLNEALSAINTEQRIDTATIKSMIGEVLLKAYKDYWCQENNVNPENANDVPAEVDVDWDKGTITIYDTKQVVPTDDDIEDDFLQTDVATARQFDPEIQAGQTLRVKVDPTTLSRGYIRKVVSYFHQRIREKAKEILLNDYAEKIEHIIIGTVESYDEHVGYELRFNRATGLLGARDRIKDETFALGEQVPVYLIGISERDGRPSLNISRTHDGFVRALIANEVPEVADGTIKIVASAREAGVRTKLLLVSTRPEVDPVGTCVGQDAVRSRALNSVLGAESIDFIKWVPDGPSRIIQCLQPAKVIGLQMEMDDPGEVLAIVPNGSKKVAVGKGGSNVRLAGRLCKCEIRIMELDEALSRNIQYTSVEEIERQAQERHQMALELARVRAAELAAEQGAPAKAEAPATNPEPAPEAAPAAVKAEPAPAVQPAVQAEPTPAATEVKPAAPAVEPQVAPAAKEAIKPAEEEHIEHVTITGHAKVSLSALEQAVDKERSRKPSSKPNWRKRKEKAQDSKAENKETKPTPVQSAMPIYTQEELDEIEAQEQDEKSRYDDDYIDDYDDDSYYDDDKR